MFDDIFCIYTFFMFLLFLVGQAFLEEAFAFLMKNQRLHPEKETLKTTPVSPSLQV